MKSALLVALLSPLFLSSCSLFKGHCNAIDARRSGSDDAANWDPHKNGLKRGAVCDKEYTADQYQRDYLEGYQSKLKEMCTEERAESEGEQDGSNENYTKGRFEKYRLCEQVNVKYARFEKAYNKGFEKTFCSQEKAAEHGQKDASNLTPVNVTYIDKSCSHKKAALYKTYLSRYDETIQDVCREENIIIMAEKDANDGRIKADQMKKIGLCPKRSNPGLTYIYSSTYDKRNMEIKLERERAERERQINEIKEKIKRQSQELEAQKERSSQVEFSVDGKRLYSTCTILPKRAQVTISNTDMFSVWPRGDFSVHFYDEYGTHIRSEKIRAPSSIPGRGESSYNIKSIPYHARTCKAFYGKGIY